MKRTLDPDKAFQQLDDDAQYKYLLLDSPDAEDLFCKHYLDLELEPYQIFSMKMLRGRFHDEASIYKFIEENDMEWMFENGYIRHGSKSGVSPQYYRKPNVLILWPAGFGKTTIVSTRAIPIMSICDNPNARLQYIGKNENEAFSFSRSIRRELQNPRLVEDFGDFKPTLKNVPWSDQAFSVEQREWRDVRENFEFYGTNSHAELGKRSDQVYIDDIETPDTARTPDMRDKLLEWVRIGPLTSARPIWGRDGNGNPKIPKSIRWSNTARYWGTGIVGTIFHPQAFYAMVQNDPTFTSIKFDCYKDKKCTVSLSPNMLTVEDLRNELRSIKLISFNKRYRNISYNEEEMAFREVWIRGGEEEFGGTIVKHTGCLDDGRSFGQVDPSWDMYLGFDPASGSRSRWSAYAAYVVLGFNPNDESGTLYLVDFAKVQDNFDRMLDYLLEGNPGYGIEGFLRQYGYKTGTVEKNAFGKWMVSNDRVEPFIKRGIIQPHYTGNDKTDPEAGVFAMGAMIQDGKLRIPYKEPSDQERAEEYIGDLLLYPKGTNDLVMATWLAKIPIKVNATEYRSWFVPGGKGRYIHVPR